MTEHRLTTALVPALCPRCRAPIAEAWVDGIFTRVERETVHATVAQSHAEAGRAVYQLRPGTCKPHLMQMTGAAGQPQPVGCRYAISHLCADRPPARRAARDAGQ